MLEGLEISEIYYSDLEYSGRIDSEYYKKHLLYYENKISENSFTHFSKVASFLIGPFGSAFDTENYVENGDYRYVRGQDVKPFILKDGENRYVPFADFDRLSKYALKERDILVSVVGTLGNACIVQKKDLPAIFSCKSTVIRTHGINPVFALTFLNCKYGRDLLLRKERGAIQKGLNLDDLKTTIIPVFSDIFQTKIEELFYTAQSQIDECKDLYNKAEALLLSELGLTDFEPSKEAVSIKSLKESFLSSGRLDAEYYQGKYDEYENLIFCYSNGYTTVSNEFALNKDTFDSKKRGYNYIEIGDVNVTDGSFDSNFVESEDLPANAKIKVKQNDLLISKVRPYRGAVSIINTNDEDLIASGAFTVLRESGSINKESLFVLLRTPIYKDWLLKWNVGTSYPVIKDEDVLNLFIPKLPQSIQQQIAAKIQESFALKTQSNQLLEIAKRAVEVAIEEGEEKATMYIQQKIIEISNPKLIIQINITEKLSVLDFSEENNVFMSGDIFPLINVREDEVYNCLEWAIPTAIAVVVGHFSSGFFGEMGKDAYSALKIGLKKLARKGRLINVTLVGTKPVDANNKQSKSFSIQSKTKQGIPVNFLFEKDATIEEWESWIDKATVLLEENFCQDNSEMQQKIDALEQPISSPLFWTYDREIEEWMPYDMKKEQRLRYEEHIKKEKGDLQ